MHTRSKFRLLVVRLGAMGDILHALPAVTALRQAHPEWIIDWVVEPRWRALLTAAGSTYPTANAAVGTPAQPLVDALHLAPTRAWRKHPFSLRTLGEIQGLRRALANGRYDVALDLQGGIRTALIARMARCQRILGEAHPRETAARWLTTEHVETMQPHVIEQRVELAAAVAGDDLKPTPPLLPTDPAAEAWALQTLSPRGSQPAALINPGAGWGAKRWPVERYAAVAQGLLERGFRVFVNTGPGEEALTESILKTASAATGLACTLEQLIALTRRISLAIAGDTGPLHLACALGRPVVGIYGPTDPSRNGPYGTRFRILRSPDSRRDHTRHPTPEAGLLTITPSQVLEAADQLLAETIKP